MNRGAVRDYRHIRSNSNNLCLAKRNHEIGTRIFSLIICLAVKMSMFKKQHGFVTANCGAKKSVRIKSCTWTNNAQSGDTGVRARAGLRNIRSATRVSAVRKSNYHRGAKRSVRAPSELS